MSTTNWGEVRNVSATSADLFLYNEIGAGGTPASDVITQIRNLRVSTINVYINSPGGAVFDGFAIYSALNLHPAKKVVFIDGLAASIASVIAMAGDEIRMAENAMLMIHNPTAATKGGADDIRSTADVLDKLSGNILNTYARRSGQSAERVRQMMDDETWLTAAESLAAGFCTHITPARAAQATFDLSRFKNFRSAPASVSDATAAMNRLRDEFAAKLQARDKQIEELNAKLEIAEAMSAANLGVPPILNVVTGSQPHNSPGDILARYQALKGSARMAFYNEHKDAIWAANSQQEN